LNTFSSPFQVLRNYHHSHGNLKIILNRHLRRHSGRTGASITHLVYGVIRWEKILDWVIERLSLRTLEKITSDNLILLRMGIYLLLFSRSTPDYAAVNEIVGLGRDRERGFLNGVLRNAGRRRQELLEGIGDIRDPQVKYSMSAMLIDSLKGFSANPDFDLDYLNREPLFHLRANTSRISKQELKGLLDAVSMEAREIEDPECFEIRQPGKILGPVLEKGLGYLQNTGSQLVSLVAAEFARARVLDCCAAPGTKSLTLRLLKPELLVAENDISRKRMRVLQRHRRQCGLPETNLLVSDIRQPALKNRFDLILVDAPCSSSGTLRKNPDLKLKLDADSVGLEAELQANILESVFRTFPGSHILFAVCSFLSQETEDLLEKIAGRIPPGQMPEPMDLSELPVLRAFSRRRAKWGTYLLPDPRLNNDLFYLALLKNRSEQQR
jgi:16S rRNA (cytosine967-C5)-methyltransferase